MTSKFITNYTLVTLSCSDQNVFILPSKYFHLLKVFDSKVLKLLGNSVDLEHLSIVVLYRVTQQADLWRSLWTATLAVFVEASIAVLAHKHRIRYRWQHPNLFRWGHWYTLPTYRMTEYKDKIELQHIMIKMISMLVL